MTRRNALYNKECRRAGGKWHRTCTRLVHDKKSNSDLGVASLGFGSWRADGMGLCYVPKGSGTAPGDGNQTGPIGRASVPSERLSYDTMQQVPNGTARPTADPPLAPLPGALWGLLSRPATHRLPAVRPRGGRASLGFARGVVVLLVPRPRRCPSVWAAGAGAASLPLSPAPAPAPTKNHPTVGEASEASRAVGEGGFSRLTGFQIGTRYE